MERSLRRSATTKMAIVGGLGVVFGVALLGLGGVAGSVRLLALGGVFVAGGVVQIVKGEKHLRGDR